MASTTPNSLGVNGTFSKGSTKITLASAVNVTLDQGESAWTPSANVTCTTSTTRKQGATSASIAIGSSFTTGLAAYVALGGSTDLSGYQQLSFWMQQTAGTLSGFTVKICTDGVGAVAANTFTIPAPVVLGGWNRVTVNLGSAMSAAAQSIAFYVDSDNGAQTYLIDNMVACKAPGTGELTHKTLIGKAKSLGAGGDDSETWYAIRDITTTTITLDLLNSSNAGSTTNGRYWGTSETVTAYSLFPSYVPTSVVSADLQWTAGGTDSSTLTISGGWNRTDMTTQTGQTWLAIGNQPSTGLSFTITGSYLDISRFHIALGTTQNGGWAISHTTIGTSHCIGITGNTISGNDITITKILQVNGTTGITFNGMDITAGVGILSDQSNLSFVNCVGSTFTIDSNSVNTGVTPSHSSKIIFNGTTYGSFGEASTVAAVMASTGDTSITLTKALEMLAAFIAGKVSVSSVGGISTYTYKKRDGTTTSFTALCSESDGTRNTTGSLS